MEKKVETTSQDIAEKKYIIRALYRRKITSEPADVVELMRNLMARLIQYDNSVQMLPYEDTCKANPLVSAQDIPSEVDDFRLYVPNASIHQKSKFLKMNFRISANKPLWSLKLVRPIRNYIEKYGIYIDQTFLVSIESAKIGGVVMSHIQFTRRDEAAEDLNKRINENESELTPVQLTPHTIWNSNGEKKISTKLLAVECSKQHTREVRRRIFQKLFNLPESMRFSNTRFFNFIPFSASGVITDQVIRSGIYLQNQFLNETTAVTIVKIATSDWIVPSTTSTFREMILMAEGKEVGVKLFTTVERGAGNKKMYLVTTKSNLNEASTWVDEFTRKMETISSSAQYWKNQTGFISPPERVNRAETSTAHQAYANFLGQTFGKSLGNTDDISASHSAPKKLSYSRVVYGKTEGSSNTTATNSTETSTITAGDIVSRECVEEIKTNLLSEVLKLNNASDKRVERVESATQKCHDVLKGYDEVLKAMVQNIKNKENEFEKYENRLDQIGDVGISTAAKVDKNSVEVKITSTKIDKLGSVFKQFIQEMARHGTTNPINLNAIANLLDDDDPYKMEVDEVLVSQSSSSLNTQPSPGMNRDSALGGEGRKR